MELDRDKLRALAEKATPGPWSVRTYIDAQWNERQISIEAPINGSIWPIGVAYKDNAVWLKEGESEDNAAYIAAANPAVMLALLDRIKALEDSTNG